MPPCGISARRDAPIQRAPREAEQHWVRFYETDGFLADEVTRFIADGLLADEPAVIIATKAHRDAFNARLRAHESIRAYGEMVDVLWRGLVAR